MWPRYAAWWDHMVINASRLGEFNAEAQRVLAHKAIYQAVAASPGCGQVQWYHIALIHMREADGDFACYLGNGQPLDRKTTEVPEGRGPFFGPNAFTNGCIDALRCDGLTSVIDWRLEKILFYCELYNGFGYAMRGLPSPYLWGGTNVQRPGKYVGDRRWNGRVWDTQPGCAPLLQRLAALDPTIQLVRET